MKKIISLSFLLIAATSAALAQTKTVTNFDLDKYRARRVQANNDYDREAAKRGLPTREELDAQELERQQKLHVFAENAKARQAQAEDFYQSQAFALRQNLAAVNAQINVTAAQFNEIPAPQTYYSVGYLPYGGYGGGFPQFPNGGGYNQVGVYGGARIGRGNSSITIGGGYNQTSAPQNGVVFAAPRNGQRPRANPNYNNAQRSNNALGANTNLYFGSAPYTAGLLSAPFTLPTPENLTREQLLANLRALEQTRAAIIARYRVLQDDARRNGVKID